MARPDQTTDNDQGRSPNLVGPGSHGTYYEFAVGHVGQDEEKLGDDGRRFDTMYGPVGAKGSKSADIALGNKS